MSVLAVLESDSSVACSSVTWIPVLVGILLKAVCFYDHLHSVISGGRKCDLTNTGRLSITPIYNSRTCLTTCHL